MGIYHNAVKSSHDTGTAAEWNDDHKVQGNLDFRHYTAENMRIENRTDWPAGPAEGRIVYRSDLNNPYIWNGSMWQSLTPVATIVVAADGSGNFTDIQDGIDALPAGGGVVYIKEGTYTLTAGLTIPNANIALIGAGNSTIITTGLAIELLYSLTKTNLFISQIQFNGNASATTCIHLENSTGAKIVDCNIHNPTVNNIWLDDSCDRTLISNNHLGSGPTFGIWGEVSNYCIIAGNWFGGADNETIHLEVCENTVISDNTFWGAIASTSVYFDSCDGSQITGNTMTSVKIGVEINDCKSVSIGSNSLLPAVADQGFFIHDSEKIAISNNTLNGITDEGIWLRDCSYCTISNNCINDTGDEAIKIESCSHIAITGESHEACNGAGGADIALTDDAVNWTTRCSITGCNIHGTGGEYDWAIEENNANDNWNNIVANNTITGSVGQIRVQGANSQQASNL